MVVYIDESGNSGCTTKDGKLSYPKDNQPLYGLAAVMPDMAGAEVDILGRYSAFKARHTDGGEELKGSDLLTRNNNDVLDEFIDGFIGSCPVEICIYSKDFYIATAIMQSALGPDAKSQFPCDYYTEASNLALFGRESLDAYAKYSSNPTEEAARILVDKLLTEKAVRNGGLLWSNLKYVTKEGLYSSAFDRGIMAGDYENPLYQNLINITAFGELLLSIKYSYGINNEDIEIVHDHILEFQPEYFAAFSEAGINLGLTFEDSSKMLGIQLADNMASIAVGIAKRVLASFGSRKPWDPANKWLLRLWSKIFSGIGPGNFKLVLPLQSQAFLFAVAEMYIEGFPLDRNALTFNDIYRKHLNECISNLCLIAEYDNLTTIQLLKR